MGEGECAAAKATFKCEDAVCRGFFLKGDFEAIFDRHGTTGA